MNWMFLICAMALPSPQFNHGIVSYRAVWDESEMLRQYIEKISPGADIVIGPLPSEEQMRKNWWTRLPFVWNGQEVWIRRKPVSDKRIQTSA